MKKVISITNQNDCDFIWDEEQEQCFKDANRDGNYSLCESEITKYTKRSNTRQNKYQS